MEMLIDFKVSYGKALKTVAQMLEKFRPDMDLGRRVRDLSIYGGNGQAERSNGKSRCRLSLQFCV